MADGDPVLSESKSQEETKKPSRAEKRRTGAADPLAREHERQLDFSLRPRALAEFVGQQRLKQVLGMSIEAARKTGRGARPCPILASARPLQDFACPYYRARTRRQFTITSGPAIERAGDLAAIVSDLD
jgi:holliday junction DNA helicase RuvB